MTLHGFMKLSEPIEENKKGKSDSSGVTVLSGNNNFNSKVAQYHNFIF